MCCPGVLGAFLLRNRLLSSEHSVPTTGQSRRGPRVPQLCTRRKRLFPESILLSHSLQLCPFFFPEELKGLLCIITCVLTRANWSFVTEEKPSLISKVKTSVGGTWVYLTGGGRSAVSVSMGSRLTMFIPSYLGELSIEREKGRAPQRAFGDKKLPEHIVELGHIFGEIH